MFYLLLNQMLMMFTLILFGFLLVKTKMLTGDGAHQISKILSYYVVPASMIASFHAPFDLNRLKLFGWCVVAAFLTIVSRIAVNHFVFRKDERIDKYAATFPNSGFFGIPIVTAIVGIEGVFYMTAYIMVNNIVQWTYGRALISGDPKAITIRKAFLNPGMIGAVIGLILYISQIPMPDFLWRANASVAELNTPLAMFIIGSYLANTNLKEIFATKRSYLSVGMRLVLSPWLAIIVIYLLPINSMDAELVLTIASVAPAAVNTAILGRLFGGDYEYGARIVVLSSLFSLITIPIILPIATKLFEM